MLLNVSETPNETFSRFCSRQKHQMKLFSCFCTRQKHQMKLFHASARDRNTKWNFFVFLHTTETPNETFSRFCTRQKHQMETFSRFCTRQKHQMEIFHASAHDRNTKWKFFMLLHMTETPNGNFSRF